MAIEIRRVLTIPAAELADLYQDSGLVRPVQDLDRIGRMIANSNLIMAAYDGDSLVGAARALSDFSYATYLSDLAVRKDRQREGIGKQLIEAVRREIGPESMLLLCAGPLAREYYPHIGFDAMPHAWIIHRTKV